MKTPRKQSKSSISNFSALLTPAELQQSEQQYSVEISNRFIALDGNISSASIQSGYDNYQNRRQSQLSVLPKRKRQRERERERERERKRERERALTVLAKALTVLCLDKKKPAESLETIEMITITYHTVKLQ